ncbi:MAG: type II toxin-antitoxin system HicA family toxin [Defluviitaleaceae bacterium]|nr:type II toxin-antitoxin system HicA family toxin [Defluviitaleaceae bacterium]
MQKKKLLGVVINNHNNVKFSDFVSLLKHFGFELKRVNGSHHIYKNHIIGKSINIQNDKGEAKSYQVKQFLEIIEKCKLEMED